MPSFNVSVSRCYGILVQVEADSPEQAEDIVEAGEWNESNIVGDEELTHWTVERGDTANN